MEACPADGQPAYDFENQPGPGVVSHFTQVLKIFMIFIAFKSKICKLL